MRSEKDLHKNLIQGLEDNEQKYDCACLEGNGFVLEKIQIPTTAELQEELRKLVNSTAIKGISFQNMGQEKSKRSHGKARKILIPSKKQTSGQTIANNLKHLALYMRSVEKVVKKRIVAETGREFIMNDYTLLINSPHGADCQEPHMDHKLYCKCNK